MIYTSQSISTNTKPEIRKEKGRERFIRKSEKEIEDRNTNDRVSDPKKLT